MQQFVIYKAANCGISVELINPAYTSQICHQCLILGLRSGELFKCSTCGEKNADANASHIIAMGGAAVNRPELAAKS